MKFEQSRGVKVRFGQVCRQSLSLFLSPPPTHTDRIRAAIMQHTWHGMDLLAFSLSSSLLSGSAHLRNGPNCARNIGGGGGGGEGGERKEEREEVLPPRPDIFLQIKHLSTLWQTADIKVPKCQIIEENLIWSL